MTIACCLLVFPPTEKKPLVHMTGQVFVPMFNGSFWLQILAEN